MGKVTGSETPQEGRCGAKLRGQDAYCQAPLAEGAKRCRRHGGAAPQAKAKEIERVETRKNEDIMRRALPFGTPKDTDPQAALLQLISDKAQEVEFLRFKVEELGDDAKVWGPTEHQEGVGPMGAVDMTTVKAVPNTWWLMLRSAEDQLAKYATAALRAGIEERQVRIAEATVSKLVGAIQRALASVNLTPETREQFDASLARELRTLESGAA